LARERTPVFTLLQQQQQSSSKNTGILIFTQNSFPQNSTKPKTFHLLSNFRRRKKHTTLPTRLFSFSDAELLLLRRTKRTIHDGKSS